jgi:alanine dehydrogenase
MRIGIPKERKSAEMRVGLTPASVRELCGDGHTVFVQTGAGEGAGAGDAEYLRAGAEILPDAPSLFDAAMLIVKVKEPQPAECALLKPEHVLFAYLHLAPDPTQTRALVESGATCIAYETVTGDAGDRPLLTPMSQVAGRLSVQAGAASLEAVRGGAGLLLGGVPGVPPAKVAVLGGGVVGTNAIQMALGLGADVTVLDRDVERLGALSARYGTALKTSYSTVDSIERFVLDADLVIGAVLIPGATAPRLVRAQHVAEMRRGSVLVDVAIDQGGCFETSRPTTHADPTYQVDGVVHYCVANMPGAVPKTSTYALNHATLPFVRRLAGRGVHDALYFEADLRSGLNVCRGQVTEPHVAQAHGYEYVDPSLALEAMP